MPESKGVADYSAGELPACVKGTKLDEIELSSRGRFEEFFLDSEEKMEDTSEYPKTETTDTEGKQGTDDLPASNRKSAWTEDDGASDGGSGKEDWDDVDWLDEDDEEDNCEPDGDTENTEQEGRRKRRFFRRHPREGKRRGFRYSKRYLLISIVFWILLLGACWYLKERIIGTDPLEMEKGRLWYRGLLAGIVGSAVLSMFVLHPLQRIDETGRRLKGQFMPWHLLLFLAVDAYAFWIIEYVNNPDFSKMEPKYMALNLAGILIMNLIVFFWLNSMKRAMLAVLTVWSVFAAAFYIVYACKGEPLQLIDIISIRTAITVTGSYQVDIVRSLVVDGLLFFSLAGIILELPEKVIFRKGLIRKILLRVAVTGIMIGMNFFYLNVNWNGNCGILTDLFAPIKTYKEYGTTVGFFCVAKYMRLTQPDGYSVKEAKSIAEKAEEEQEPNTVTDVKPVNVIVVMNESWCDYRYVGDLVTNKEIMPFYDSLKENTIKGHSLVCITGGGTAKTEYEFLTGNSVKRFPAMVPFVSYFTHDQYSIVSTLEAQGFASVAMHPYKGSNWNRPNAYKLLGFDQFLTIDDFDENALKFHSHVSDMADYDKIFELVENKKDPEDPLFIFNVTMQNHGGYTRDDVNVDVRVDGFDDPQVNRFLSLMKRSDEALEYLIKYFEKKEEPTIILMFGDHYPSLPEEFANYLSGSTIDELEPAKKVHYYSTPFLIWANYDIPEAENVMTSTNYLGTMLLEQTGLKMADYNYYLKNLRKTIPALNHMGYYDTEGIFHEWSDKSRTEELEAEKEYEILQYNNLAESSRRLDDFFGMKTADNKE
ncbi:MAG: sulfatase-like hydrolase/transferase [Eubacteriales bacterium]|nr:sulfatase-like hydrolase/transferase [Eubacteriales bacterium]